MPCWYTAIQLCCEEVIMHANMSIQQGHKACDNMLQSLSGQPLARSQLSLQMTALLHQHTAQVSIDRKALLIGDK